MKKPTPMADEPSEPVSIDTRLVRKLAAVLTDTGLSEIEVEHKGLKIRVARTFTAAAAPMMAPAPTLIAAPAAPPAAAPAPPPAAKPAGEVLKSPMVGTVYLQPQPGAPAFAKVGDKVAEGQTLLLVEAMKTMNPITAPKAGTLLEYLVSDSQPVEYGEPLAVIG